MAENHSHVHSRRYFLGAAGTASLAGLAGCTGGGDSDDSGDDETTGEPTSGGRLVFAQNAAPSELDPINNRGGNYSIVIKNWIYDALYTYDDGTNLVPLMATDLPEFERDGQRLIIEIDDDATFQDGEPVTAGDVAYTFTAPAEESTDYAADFAPIDEITEVDEKTVQLDLAQTYNPILYSIAFPIAPRHLREEDPEAFGVDTVVGAGPFEFVEQDQGNFTLLERDDDYWGEETPLIEELEFVTVQEPTTRVTELRNDEVNIANNIPPDNWPVVEGIDDASIVSGPELNYQFAAFNMNEGETAKQEVREAIDYCVDINQAVENFVAPVGERMYSILPEPLAEDWDMPLDEWADMYHDKDIDRAQELFEQADVPDDWECTILVSSTSFREDVATSIANGITEAGYEGTVQRLDFGTLLERYDSGDADQVNMYLLGWTRAPDPDRFIYELVHPDGAFQGTYYDNEEFAQALDEARNLASREERRDLYERAVTLMIEDRVHLPLYNLQANMGVKDYVQDYTTHPVSTENPAVFTDRRLTNSDAEGRNVWLDQ